MKTKENLLKILSLIGQPKKHGLNQEAIDELLADFCAACPDPVGAYRLIAECLDPMTDEQLVDRALNMPRREMSTVSLAIVPANHPSRKNGESR